MKKLKQITVKTRKERLEFLFFKVNGLGITFQVISGLTLAIGGASMLISKFIGLSLTELQLWGLIGVSVTLATLFALFWEKGIRYLWREATDQLVHWEFEHWPVVILFFTLAGSAGFMSYVSITGSVWGGRDLATITSPVDSGPDLLAADSLLNAHAKDQVKTTQQNVNSNRNNYELVYKQTAKSYEDQISEARRRGEQKKACCSELTDPGSECCKSASWLLGGKIQDLKKQKAEALAEVRKNYSPTLASGAADSVHLNQLAVNQSILKLLTEKSHQELQTHQNRQQRHSAGFSFIAYIVTPLFVVCVIIQSLIKLSLGLISTPLSAPGERPKPEKPISRKQKPARSGSKNGNRNKKGAEPLEPPESQQKKEQVVIKEIVDAKHLMKMANQNWKRSHTRAKEQTRTNCRNKAREYVAALEEIGIKSKVDPDNKTRLIFLQPLNGAESQN